MIEPFRTRGVATIVLDHVTKSAEGRGSFAIGSERKIGGADVHLGFETVVPFGRGRTGLFKIKTHKDRFGYLPRPLAAELELRSDPDTGAVTWAFRPAPASSEVFRPTKLMQKVSLFLEGESEPVSRSMVEEAVGGRREYVRLAMDKLVAEGFAREIDGPRKARLLAVVQAFRATSPDLAPTSPPEWATYLAPSPHPLQGGEDGGVVAAMNGNATPPPTFDAVELNWR